MCCLRQPRQLEKSISLIAVIQRSSTEQPHLLPDVIDLILGSVGSDWVTQTASQNVCLPRFGAIHKIIITRPPTHDKIRKVVKEAENSVMKSLKISGILCCSRRKLVCKSQKIGS